ncbi:MAG: Septum formation initiator [Petroclostridium sp.]|jgi:cell division protein FtsB|uniref:FtsB family cell division protein n=1 Tax=Petroclostridium xylanilyticum TaxID=1792311 RepID=UPI000B990ABF|nr:septum formation initiator family protein [Petroclostridium xylanilyticum]MBZ4645085.1 Septum formation initiator [Clostridia bacterium]MDK2810533.1 Septum formation initiator [Petroclostridium sp.]
MKKKGIKSVLKKILLTASAIYVVYILIQQQVMLNYYRDQEKYYLQKIEEEKAKTEHLEKLKVLYSTEAYIEQIARDKLGFVKNGEKVFIDATNR